MTDFSNSYNEVSPFDPATGKVIRLLKGGKQPAPPTPSPTARETPMLVGQSQKDEIGEQRDRRARNNDVLAAANDQTYGQKLKLGN